MCVAQALKAVKEALYSLCHRFHLVAHKEFQIDKHLIVTRATRVNLLTHIAKLARKHQLHLRVDILNALLYHKLATLNALSNTLQRLKQHRKLATLK